MRDLELWRLLHQGDASPSRLAALLRELAKRPLSARVPYLAAAGRLVSSGNDDVKCAALSVLAGALGRPAWRTLIRSLDDPSAQVRRSGVRALRRSAASQAGRWGHALFHPRPDVRVAAVTLDPPPGARPWTFFLLGDPACAPLLADRDVDLPPSALGALAGFVSEGLVDPAEAARLLVGARPIVFHRWLDGFPHPGVEALRDLLEAEAPEAIAGDPVHFLATLLAAGHADEVMDSLARRVEDALGSYSVEGTKAETTHEGLGLRLVIASRALAGEALVPMRPVVLGLRVAPSALRVGTVPRSRKKAALHSLAVDDVGASGTRGPLVEDLLKTDLVLRDVGRQERLDLRALTGLLTLVAGGGVDWYLRTHIGIPRLHRAFVEDVAAGALLLGIKNPDVGRRSKLVEDLLAQGDRTATTIAAMLGAPMEVVERHVPHDPRTVGSLLRKLLEAEHRGTFRPGERRLAGVTRILVKTLVSGRPQDVLAAWLDRDDPASSPLGVAVLENVRARAGADRFVVLVNKLKTAQLERLVAVLDGPAVIPFGTELALAHKWARHRSEVLAVWAKARLPEEAPKVKAVKLTFDADGAVSVSARQARNLARCAAEKVGGALEPLLGSPVRGLCAPLAARKDPPADDVRTVTALLGCVDGTDEVSRRLDGFPLADARFEHEVDQSVCAVWQGLEGAPLLVDAWLYRFERHHEAFVRALSRESFTEAFASWLAVPCALLRRRGVRACANTLSAWRWRAPKELETLVTERLVEGLVDGLDTDVGDSLARMLVAFWVKGLVPDPDAVREKVRALLPDVSQETRRLLYDIASSSGLPTSPGTRAGHGVADAELLDRIRSSVDVASLEAWCRDDVAQVAAEAALRLLDLGLEGTSVLVRVLLSGEPPAHLTVIAETIPLWPDGGSLQELARAARDDGLLPMLRFRIALAFLERSEPVPWEQVACEALGAPGPTGWFGREDWLRLKTLVTDDLGLHCAGAASAHAHAYIPAIYELLRREPNERSVAAVWRYLDAGTERLEELRWRAALWYAEAEGPASVAPLLICRALGLPKNREPVFVGLGVALADELAVSWLAAGHGYADEQELLRNAPKGHDESPRVRARLLEFGERVGALSEAAASLETHAERDRKLTAIAETFAWGVRRGRELTGRLFRIHMIGGDALGYTRLDQNSIHVTVLPILTRARHGKEIVEALVLHELGHHRHHRGPEAAEVWKRAGKERIFDILNLVADEHLERNLRAYDRTYGNRLKRLAAYAFQHAANEHEWGALFDVLQHRSLAVLSRCRLEPGSSAATVRVQSGPLLLEMERQGMSFARFVRALRMGLGNRHDDPLVAEALTLFDRKFLRHDMEGLYDVCQELLRIFGAECRLAASIGGHETLGDDARERAANEGSLTDRAVQDEVERILDPGQLEEMRKASRDGRVGGKVLNMIDDESYELITTVEKIPYDLEAHRALARPVARAARQMRRYLEQLGLAMVPVRRRLRGHRFDPSRTMAVVTRGDPRMLMARETVVQTDLFLGVAIDCSGSMVGECLERAKAFGAMLAEAAAGMSGVTLRLYGFTDSVIFDAGDASRPAVAGLEVGGGNNDAAALHHVAEDARRSRRRARLLVMISDGLPTECSVHALRALVTHLSRREGMCCAQVAVRPLEEICFPHYVEVTEHTAEEAVRRFGQITARLVRRALSR